MIENIDLNFTIWLSSFDLLEGFFILLSSKYFSLFLVILFAIHMIKLERLKTFAFIFLATCFGDMTGNFLKNFLAQPRPCFEHSDYLISSGVIDQACGPSLTGMPSNHALNYFIFTTLVIFIIKNRAISLFFIKGCFILKPVLIPFFSAFSIASSVVPIFLHSLINSLIP